MTIYGTPNAEALSFGGGVSYRMTANRFDWRGYDDNLAKTDSTGLIILEEK